MINSPAAALAFLKQQGWVVPQDARGVIHAPCPCCHLQITTLTKQGVAKGAVFTVVWGDGKPFQESEGIVWAANEEQKELIG